MAVVLTLVTNKNIHKRNNTKTQYITQYRGADKSLARPSSRCILFDGENIVIHINSPNIPPIMIINRIHETYNLLSL